MSLSPPSPWLLALLVAGLLSGQCSPLPAQSLTPSSPPPDNPFWQPLNLSVLLLAQINSLVSNTTTLQQRIDNLQALSDEQAQQIKDSSQAISDSQASSQRLQGLLNLSEATRVMQEQQLKASTIFLADSQTALTKAEGSAKALAAQNGLLRFGVWTFGVTAAAGVVYAVGHAVLHWW